MTTTLGQKIHALRKEKGYTLEKLAELTDSSKSYIWELENKNPPRPSADKIAKIASVLGVTTEFLLNANEASPDASVVDQVFFRDYKAMSDDTKTKIRQLVKLWDDSKK